MVELKRPWPIVVECGRVWSSVVECGRMVAECGLSWPTVAKCGLQGDLRSNWRRLVALTRAFKSHSTHFGWSLPYCPGANKPIRNSEAYIRTPHCALEPQRKQVQKQEQLQLPARTHKKDRLRNSHRDVLIQQDNENVLRCRRLRDCFFLQIVVLEDEDIGVRAVLAELLCQLIRDVKVVLLLALDSGLLNKEKLIHGLLGLPAAFLSSGPESKVFWDERIQRSVRERYRR